MASDNPSPSAEHLLCAKCGACTTVCPVYLVTGQEALTARGRLHLLAKTAGERQSAAYRNIFSKCLLCDACRQVCPRGIDLPAMVVDSRRRFPAMPGRGKLIRTLIEKCLPNRRIMAGIAKLLRISAPVLAKLPADSGLRLKLGLSGPPKMRKQPDKESESRVRSSGVNIATMLFTGCFAAHLDKSITAA
ncbi:MAG: (Fe-S)-binding protein, partial [Desulfurivibrionaceae bacterium]|nr:(Fe-S)-binding protein [Desulfurivibrionaceae bacterium]